MSTEPEPKEPECSEDEEESEGPEAKTFTGSAYPSVARGGITYGPTVPSSVSGVWSTAPTTWTTTGSSGIKLPAKIPSVSVPPKLTDKILVAFIDPDNEEEIVWAAHLKPKDISIQLYSDPEDEPRMTIEFSLVDHYDNTKK